MLSLYVKGTRPYTPIVLPDEILRTARHTLRRLFHTLHRLKEHRVHDLGIGLPVANLAATKITLHLYLGGVNHRRIDTRALVNLVAQTSGNMTLHDSREERINRAAGDRVIRHVQACTQGQLGGVAVGCAQHQDILVFPILIQRQIKAAHRTAVKRHLEAFHYRCPANAPVVCSHLPPVVRGIRYADAVHFRPLEILDRDAALDWHGHAAAVQQQSRAAGVHIRQIGFGLVDRASSQLGG